MFKPQLNRRFQIHQTKTVIEYLNSRLIELCQESLPITEEQLLSSMTRMKYIQDDIDRQIIHLDYLRSKAYHK